MCLRRDNTSQASHGYRRQKLNTPPYLETLTGPTLTFSRRQHMKFQHLPHEITRNVKHSAPHLNHVLVRHFAIFIQQLNAEITRKAKRSACESTDFQYFLILQWWHDHLTYNYHGFHAHPSSMHHRLSRINSEGVNGQVTIIQIINNFHKQASSLLKFPCLLSCLHPMLSLPTK